MTSTDRYLMPGRGARMMNRAIAGLTRLGISVCGGAGSWRCAAAAAGSGGPRR